MTAYSVDSHPGHRRDHNEDASLADPELGLFVVADGVGGHAHGEIASALVCETLREQVAAGGELVDALHQAHRRILEEITRRQGQSNMGSTAVALRLLDGGYEVAWVGDSRAYRFDGTLQQITRDHNPVSEMLARGALTPEQAAAHPERNVLSQSLGVSDAVAVAPGRIRGELRPGEQILLCSDGLSDELGNDRIRDILDSGATPRQQSAALLQAALDAGGRDNVTVLVVGARAATAPAQGKRPDTLNDLPAVGSTSPTDSQESSPHDIKVILLLALITALAVGIVVKLI